MPRNADFTDSDIVGYAWIARAMAGAVARTIHAYPTLSESVKSALLGIQEQVG